MNLQIHKGFPRPHTSHRNGENRLDCLQVMHQPRRHTSYSSLEVPHRLLVLTHQQLVLVPRALQLACQRVYPFCWSLANLPLGKSTSTSPLSTASRLLDEHPQEGTRSTNRRLKLICKLQNSRSATNASRLRKKTAVDHGHSSGAMLSQII